MTHFWKPILLGGGLAALLDINYAILRYSPSNPGRVLHSVASGWLGRDAYQSGWQGALLGVASHFAILFVAAAIYYAASRRWQVLKEKWLLCGALFGIAIFFFMNYVVLPLSAYPRTPSFAWASLLEGLAVHAVLVGLPIGWAVGRK